MQSLYQPQREREDREVNILKVLTDFRGEVEPNQATLKTCYLSFLFDGLAQIFLASKNIYLCEDKTYP
jgi:hypothetical protein